MFYSGFEFILVVKGLALRGFEMVRVRVRNVEGAEYVVSSEVVL